MQRFRHMIMTVINHIGLFVKDIEATKSFFEKYFGATAGEMYHNPKKSFSSYMLSFGGDAKLEIMTRPALAETEGNAGRYGFAHVSLSVGSKEKVDSITQRLMEDGYRHHDGPRTTGDGFYESAILDAEGNIIEITV